MALPSAPKYTDQQAAAIQTRGVSIALSAGAGCGKTFVLTQRFLAGLESSSDASVLHSLVAITFTERAAREMRDRIRSACHQRLQQCDSSDVDHWLKVLRGLDSARISTIHSFCTSVLRAQAVEAGLDPRFAVLEPVIADTLLRNTSKETLHRLLEQADSDADEFVLKFGLERTQKLLETLARQRFQIAFEKFESQTAASVAEAWRSRWKAEFVPRLITKFRNAPLTLRLVALLQENEPTHLVMWDRREVILNWLDPECEWNDPALALSSLLAAARVQGGGNASAWPDSDIFDLIKTGFEKFRDAIKKLEALLPIDEHDLQLAAEFAERAMRLARQSSAAYEKAKQAQGLLDFDDLLLSARNLLKSRTDVRERVAASIRLLMVDEFQDTDPVQAEIVQMLCGDALTLGRLFLVGDAKQSIYRFRRADPGVFDRLRQQIPEPGRLPLSVNFRSQPAVLNFVNHLFAAGMQGSYEPLTPFDNVQRSPTPAIEFLFATFDAKDSGAGSSDQDDGSKAIFDGDAFNAAERVRATDLRKREADWIARRCAELLADATPRIRTKDSEGKPTLRRVQPGDIVILFRALSNVQDYETALRRYELDYYLVGGKAFFAQQEVFDVLNLCRYLDDPDDLIALVGILRSPFFNLSDDTIQTLALNTTTVTGEGGRREKLRQTLHDSVMSEPPAALSEEQRWRVANAKSILSNLRMLKDRLPLSKLLTRAIEQTGYDASLLTEFLGSRKVANLRKLIEMAEDFDRAELFTLKDFVQRLQTSVLEETDEEFATTLPETGEVIRLMSIHQSKGLEFPIVIVADIDRKQPPRGKSGVLHPDLGALVKLPDSFGVSFQNLGLKMFELLENEADAEETIRLFYVACTRAADYLILSAGIEIESSKRSPWLQLVESRFDITTGLPKTDPLLGSSIGKTAGRETIPDIRAHHAPAAVELPKRSDAKLVPIAELGERIRASEPTQIPWLAQRLDRDVTDVPPLSVSRLEAIDAQLVGVPHVKPDRSANFETPSMSLDQATELGTLIHAVLEQVDFTNPDAWPKVLEAVVTSSRDHLSEETVSSAGRLISRFLESPIAADLAEAKSLHREVEFVLRWPSSSGHPILIRGIIDILYEDAEGGWHILDYKTNDFPASAADKDLLAPYEFQLAVYAHAITQWLGIAPSELALIALRPTARRIVLPWSPEKWKSMEERIHASLRLESTD